MSVWIFHLDTVIEISERICPPTEYYYQSYYYDSELFGGTWSMNDGYRWQLVDILEVPSKYRAMALLLT